MVSVRCRARVFQVYRENLASFSQPACSLLRRSSARTCRRISRLRHTAIGGSSQTIMSAPFKQRHQPVVAICTFGHPLRHAADLVDARHHLGSRALTPGPVIDDIVEVEDGGIERGTNAAREGCL